jgi:diacylglycerol kinase family enzyme
VKIAVILNKSANAIKNDKELSSEIILKKFKSFNIDCDIKFVEGKYLEDTAKQALSDGYNAVVAGGGDGTISSIASALAGSSVPLGILPLGTLNHFAKDLKIPMDFDEAVKTISKMITKTIDVGEVNGRVFINNSSIGFYPKIVSYRKLHSKRLRMNKWLAMIIAFFNVFRSFPLVEVKLHSEKDVIKIKTPFVFIGNNYYQVDLFNVGERANINKGELYIYFPRTKGRISMLRFALLALSNNLKQAEDFVIESSENITLETKKKYLKVSADGEVYKLESPLHYKIKPLSLKVIATE